MLPLLIRITNAESGEQRDAGFRRSPVRIGRNKLNDLALDESFVSEWHGIVRFDEDATRFLDVGSTNGTLVDDEPLEKNTEVTITEESQLVIGPLTLRALRMPLEDSQILRRSASAFSLGGTQDAGLGQSSTGTMMLSGRHKAVVTLPGKPPEMEGSSTGDAASSSSPDAPPMVGGAAPEIEGLGEIAKRMAGKMKEVRAAYKKHEGTRSELEACVRRTLDQAGTDHERRGYLSSMRDGFPRALDHKEIRVLLEAPASSGGVDAESWLGRLVGTSHSDALGDPQAAMERAGALLEAFATAYVDLIKGQRQVRAQLSVEDGGEGSPLHEITDARVLLAYLLDGSADGRAQLDDLSRAFADIVVHQLGMLHGAIDGARALIIQLSPQGIGAVPRGALASTSFGLGDYFWPFRAAGRYYRYATKHQSLSSEAQFSKVLFGGAFSKAYYRVTGSRSRASAPPRQSR